MKKYRLIFLLFLLAGCSKGEEVATLEHPSPDQELLLVESGLSLSLAQDFYEGPPEHIGITLENKSPIDFGYGEYSYIEVKKGGEWYTLKHSDAVFLENPEMTDAGMRLRSGERAEQQFSIDMLGIILVPGEYRLVKTFTPLQEPYFEVSLAAPFTVE